MQNIDPASLKDLTTRVQYLRDFIGFTEEDAAALHAAAPVVAPLVPTVVDTVYEKLFTFDITAQSFVPRQTGYTGQAPVSLKNLNVEHPQIKFRKDFLSRYLVKLVTMDYEKPESWEYLDKVGLMHTGTSPGFLHRAKKPALRVEYIHCGILLGYVEDILVDAVINHPDLDLTTKSAVIRAANKIIWIQNDLFARHYVQDSATALSTITIDKVTANATVIILLAIGGILSRFFTSNH
ncbi:Protoglobin-domain-containing protein [Panaeolus papilionaceus]|nr:Protoglobin-domain-containing protein [Panaeolus papilionaceus]